MFMNLRQIKCFLLISELRNFSRAAEHLYITQSAATQQIRAMEDELGFSLFIRNKRNVELTEAGQQLYTQIKSPYETIEHAISKLQTSSSQKHLTLAYYPVTKEHLIPRLHQLCRQQLPQYTLTLERCFPEEMLPALHAHRIDLALLSLEDIELQRDTIEFIPLIHPHFVCIMPKNHPLSNSSVIHRDMLIGQTIAVPRSAHPWKTIQYIRDFILPIKDQVQIVESDSGDGINTLLSSYHAITIRPSYAMSDSISEVNIPLDCDYKMQYGLAINKNCSADIRRIAKTAKDYFSSQCDPRGAFFIR